MSNINKIKVSGTTYNIQDLNATKTVELTQAEYDALSVKDQNVFYIITDAQGADLSNYYTKSETSGATEISTALESKADTATTYTKTETDNAITAATSTKQDTLVSGTNIKTINGETLLGEGNITIQGGGSSTNVVQTTGTSTTDVMSQDAVTNAFNEYTVRKDSDNGIVRYWTWKSPNYPYGQDSICNFSINGRCPLSKENGVNSSIWKFSLVETSAITTSVTSSSTDSQVPSAKAVYDQFGGLKLVKLTQSEYDSLTTKDNSTLYVIVN